MLEDMGDGPGGPRWPFFHACSVGGSKREVKTEKMTKITPEKEVALTEDRLLSLMELIGELRHTIEDLKREAKAGGDIDSAETAKRLNQFNTAVLACNKAETTLDECRNKQAGIARGGYALDMDQARADIGCKLDQLRRCGDPGTVLE